jgi:hypothetical protein
MLKNILATLTGVLILSMLSFSVANAALSPVSVAIFPGLQFPPEDFSVTGARISAFWGEHRGVYGVDLGVLGNITEQNFVGIGISGIFNYTQGDTTVIGLQAAGMTNVNTNKTHVYGIQAAAGINSNTADSAIVGLEVAAIANLSPHSDIVGLQVGLYNQALNVYGFQVGVVNKTDSLHGLQIGLINFNNKGLFSVSPILNFGF